MSAEYQLMEIGVRETKSELLPLRLEQTSSTSQNVHIPKMILMNVTSVKPVFTYCYHNGNVCHCSQNKYELLKWLVLTYNNITSNNLTVERNVNGLSCGILLKPQLTLSSHMRQQT